jgi:hypothetical protein
MALTQFLLIGVTVDNPRQSASQTVEVLLDLASGVCTRCAWNTLPLICGLVFFRNSRLTGMIAFALHLP